MAQAAATKRGNSECDEEAATSESLPLLPAAEAKLRQAAAENSSSRNPVTWLRALDARLPSGTLASVFVTHVLLKGLVAGGGDEGLIFKPIEFLFAKQHMPAHQLQGVLALGAVSPWVIKPLLGAFSDMLPLFGRKRNSYIVLVTILAFISVMGLALGFANTTGVIVLCMFFASLQNAMCTLLVDAKRSEIVKENPKLSPDLVTFTEVGMNSGLILSALFVGGLLTHGSTRLPQLIALPLIGAPLLLVLGNWLHDEPLSAEGRRANIRAISQNPMLFGLGCLLLPLLLVLALGSVVGLSQHTLAVCGVVGAVVIIIGYSVLIRPEISGPVVLYFCLRCLNVPLNGAMFYFLTDSPTAYPDGPHFTPFFYASVLTTVAIVGRLVGYWTAKDLFGRWHYRHALFVTVPVCFVAQLLMVPFLARWNVALHVPDYMWMLPCTFIDMVARGWRHYPFSVMLLQATPKGLEASTIALNTGASNMGTTLSVIFGGYLMSRFGVQPAGYEAESGNFAALWQAQIVAASLPLLVLPLVHICMPRRRQDETLILTHLESATHGSLLERFRALC
eukprot:TRINITY_DN55282_c0_g1_i1.p1 TRINITY_DN55282_c0_g1~~TRINITY_DN55282_c0_g1_i1.p1  ORF type:complete len:563 (-),score=102.88 TRINITY_DN55282_c0_g1_i1:80-1768(-)